MRVKLKKDLPFVMAGSIGNFIEEEEEIRFSGESYQICKEDIERKTDWFEILPKQPVWAGKDIRQINSIGGTCYFQLAEEWTPWRDCDPRELQPLLEASPEMWSLLKRVLRGECEGYGGEALEDIEELLNRIENDQ